MLEIRNLKKQYEISCPLKDINVTINKGDVVCIIGPSGTGKSTLLRMINLLDSPTSGKIYLDDEEITAPGYKKEKARRKMAMDWTCLHELGKSTSCVGTRVKNRPQHDLRARGRFFC